MRTNESGIQMNPKELTKTFMMISNGLKRLSLNDFYKTNSALYELSGWKLLTYVLWIKTYVFLPNSSGFEWVAVHYSELYQMTLPSWHKIRNSNPDGLRSSALPLNHIGFSQF